MKRLNHAGRVMAEYQELEATTEHKFGNVFFFDCQKCVATADRLGPARMVAPGTVAVSASGRQWIAVGGNRIHGATGWRFVSPYVDQGPIDHDAVRFIDNPKALKIRAKLDAYLEYYQSVKGVLPRSVVLRREQLATCGAMPGQLYKGIRLEAFS